MKLFTLIKGATAALLLALPALFAGSYAAEAGEWRHCAGEDRFCSIPSNGFLRGDAVFGFDRGQVFARFGTNGRYQEQYMRGTSFRCHNDTFAGNDPIPFFRKACYVWVFSFVKCANEGEYCQMDGAYTVRYGTSNSDRRYYVQASLNGGFFCGNGAFGRDPVRNQRKACWVYKP